VDVSPAFQGWVMHDIWMNPKATVFGHGVEEERQIALLGILSLWYMRFQVRPDAGQKKNKNKETQENYKDIQTVGMTCHNDRQN
jgi:hypothetical protein